ncbi:probable UDP-3-O-acyl-N-acetylglucosamine deacetylase 1, mitochondrial isoform X2 [Aristolochia californica]|uniref:probable UDP-3-O-acyl-N-acetylglucosamine deacetylase 1, mitochondrial isoform X2 n=1 Tax=Aristolochia californica TaxID=171875 RepID=UPI0035DBEA72
MASFMEAIRKVASKFSKLSAVPISWKEIGVLQQTLVSKVSRSGVSLHSGACTTATICPARAGEGRFFVCGGHRIPASVDFVSESPLCTTLCRNGTMVRTVEHLLSALEAVGVDNCRIEITGGNEVPLLDGSAKQWVQAIEEGGLCIAKDDNGNSINKRAPFVLEPVHLWRNDSFVAAFPSSTVHITYGIDFPQVERLRSAGLIQGGSTENAIVCSTNAGWLNPPLHFDDEPCRHKVLDLIGDLSLFAQDGHQGLPVGHIIAYKGGHSLHIQLLRLLSGSH